MIIKLLGPVSFLQEWKIGHHDIKPLNTMIDSQGKIKYIDLDFLKKYEDNEERLTDHWGTAGYLPF